MPQILRLNRGREITKDYNVINLEDDTSARIAKMEMWIAKNIGDALVHHYPNREWNVNVDLAGQMVVVSCPSLSSTHGYHLAMRRDSIDELRKRSVRAAGEILERFGISRARSFNPEQLETLERMPNGDAYTPDAADTVPLVKDHND